MNENESMLKAMSLIAAELHIQNLMTISINKKIQVDFSYVSEIAVPALADHFGDYFKGGKFSPGSVVGIKVEVDR